MTYAQLAEHFRCSYAQARKAHKDYLEGRLSYGRTRRPKKRGRPPKTDGDATLLSQYETALAEMAASNFDPKERIVLLEKLTVIRQTIQKIELTHHLKRRDAEIIKRIIHRYEPEVSDDRVIAIYHEEVERWKASL